MAANIKIGIFSLPCRFEDDDLSDIVRYVVTNDVVAYAAATTAFTPPFLEKDGLYSVRNENTPSTTWYRPPLYENGISYIVENGLTNCVIRRSLTDSAKALEMELPMRTNLALKARMFIDSIADGTITNKPVTELRSLTRMFRNGTFGIASESDGSDADVVKNFVEIREHAFFLPLTILDASHVQDGTNTCYLMRARVDTPNEPSYARSISMFPIVYAGGHWNLCIFPY